MSGLDHKPGAHQHVIDASAPRALDSDVIAFSNRGTIFTTGLLLFIGLMTAMVAVMDRHWVMVTLCGVADIGLLTIIARVLLSWYRVRRVWRFGQLVEVTVRRSTVAWQDFNGGAYTLELDIAGGSTLTFDYGQGQIEGAVVPALVHDGWILVVFSSHTIALERLTPAVAV